MGQRSANRISRPKHVNNLERLSRMAQPADMQEALSAVLATTRREWKLPLSASAAADKLVVKHSRVVRPSIRYFPDAKRGAAWRTRTGRQEQVESLARFAGADNSTDGAA